MPCMPLRAGPGGRPPEQVIRHLMPTPRPHEPATQIRAPNRVPDTRGPDPLESASGQGRPLPGGPADAPHPGTAGTRRSPAGVRTGKVTRVNRNDEELAVLRDRHPGWQIWRVDRYLGGPLWCARPLGQTQPVLNAARPGRLSELIEEAGAGLAAAGPSPGMGPPSRPVTARRFRMARRADTVPPSWLCPAGPAQCSLPVLPRAR
jgi:hypothetical protein